MEILIIIGIVMSYVILYFIIKTAVRNGIIEARKNSNGEDAFDNDANLIPQKTCPGCNKNHDFNYPKCPYCDYAG